MPHDVDPPAHSGPDGDEALLDQFRAVFDRVDPVPPAGLDAARRSFSGRDPEREVAELAHDSLVGGPGTARLLLFRTDQVTLEVTVSGHGDRREVCGRLTPAQGGTVEVHDGRGVLSLEVDDLGRFRAADVGRGPRQFRFGGSGTAPSAVVATDWLVL